MMRLVLVHGINNQGNSSAAIERDWVGWMERTLNSPGLFDNSVERVAPFYGDELHRLEGVDDPLELVKQGVGASDAEAEIFLSAAIGEIAANAGITPAAILAEMQVLGLQQPETMGLPPHDRNFIAFVRLIQALSPFQGEIALRLLNQAFIYLKRPAVTAAVDSIVGDALQDGQATVILAHSLGTIVTFKLLRKFAAAGSARNVPLFVTVGSPLAIKAVQAGLGKPRIKPNGVAKWLNARDPDDFVTLGQDLNTDTFASGIDNISDVDNPGEDAHAIEGYLGDKRVATSVARACSLVT